MMTDPIADMLTRLRNANRIELPAVDMPSTHMKEHISQVLKDEGFIVDFQVGMYAKEEGKRVSATGRSGRAEENPADFFEVRSGRGACDQEHRTGKHARSASLSQPQATEARA